MRLITPYLATRNKSDDPNEYIDVPLSISHLNDAITFFSRSHLADRYNIDRMKKDRDFLR